MLFSRTDVSGFINAWFEPVWQSVRPVPIIRIDFGNGKVVTRTLHGNIATYVCSADGEVLDVAGGIYTPEGYLERLGQFRLLANHVDQEGKAKRAARLRAYHEGQLTALQKNEEPARFINVADISKRRIEGGVKAALVRPEVARTRRRAAPSPKEENWLKTAEDRALWAALAEDTRANETVRRRQVHKMLIKAGLVGPEKLTKGIYKAVLHADLDDPYLGLGKVLFAGYPFKQ